MVNQIKIIFFVSILLICYSCLALKINSKQLLSNRSLQVEKINAISPYDTVWEDLEFLNAILDNKKIILLGEAEHYDETTFAAKVRIIKFLHEKMDFDILIFEAGRFECEYLVSNIETFDSTFFQNTLWNFWADSKSCQQLFSYIINSQDTENKIFVNGFDIQPSGIFFSPQNQSYRHDIMVNYKIVNTIETYLQKKENTLNNFPKIKSMLYFINYQGYLGKFGQAKYDSIKNEINDLIKVCYIPPISKHDTVFANFFDNFYNYIEFSRMGYGTPQRFQYRDSLMAENFIDIYEKYYPNKKVIVWLANLHALYDDSQYKTTNPTLYFNTFGEYLKNKYKDKLYSLCFTSFVNVDKDGNVFNKSTPSTFEYQLHNMKYNFAFIDFRKNKNSFTKPFTTRINQNLILKANWAKMCDGIFYIDTVQQNK